MPVDALHVAVAAIVNSQARVLLSLRPDHVHQGGLWEFPGGKLEHGETVMQALERELAEELGIHINAAQPLIRIPHQYPDRHVLLDVWRVTGFSGRVHGREGQSIEWVDIDSLADRSFPDANKPIIQALQLPDAYMITPQPGADPEEFLDHLQRRLQQGIRLLQWRAPSLPQNDYLALAEKIVKLAHAHDAKVLLNGEPAWVQQVGADGLQLNSHRLQACTRRPLDRHHLVIASCHDPEQLRHAQAIDADAAVLSPVQATASHPDDEPLGWPRFAAWVDACAVPVYALGGMTAADTATAVRNGAQGVAAIRALWTPT